MNPNNSAPTNSTSNSTASELSIRGGKVLTPEGFQRMDVLVQEGKIAAIEKDLPTELELDARSCLVSPGLVDIHTHLRQPGQEEAETIESGSRAAALGGFTALLAMPNTTPAIDSPSVIREIQELALSAVCEIHIAGAITLERKGDHLAPLAEMAALGVKIFTDDGRGVQDDGLMRRALEYSSNLGIRLAQHCEVESLSINGQMNEGEWSSKLGLTGIPNEAEELMVARDIALCRLTSAPVHFQHLSTQGSVELVRNARAEGLDITCEAAPHHFSLTEECLVNYDTVYKVNPPLRTPKDVACIKSGMAEGVIDAVATDHAPHPTHLKELAFEEAPPGMLGLETALALALEELGLPPEEVLQLMSINPAQIAGMHNQGEPLAVGRPANICVFDPSQKWIMDKTKSPSLSSNNPYDKRNLKGKVCHTIFRGTPVVRDGVLVE